MKTPRECLIYRDGHEWDGYEKWSVSFDIKNEWVLSKKPIHMKEVLPDQEERAEGFKKGIEFSVESLKTVHHDQTNVPETKQYLMRKAKRQGIL